MKVGGGSGIVEKKEVEEELRRAKKEGVLNIQLLVIRSLPHSSSSLECVEGKTYNEKMQFVQMIIHDIYRIGTYVVEFLCRRLSRRSWCARKQIGQGATLVDPVFIEESEEDEGVES
jgi:hypothetical protein